MQALIHNTEAKTTRLEAFLGQLCDPGCEADASSTFVSTAVNVFFLSDRRLLRFSCLQKFYIKIVVVVNVQIPVDK